MVHIELPPDAPSPRLCFIQKYSDDQEYGFNLHAERGKGQFIGAVDENSIAARAGLKAGDRIFAINGESIVNLSHKEVVRRIKFNLLQCEILVLSEEGVQWYAEHEIGIDLNLPNIIRMCYEDEKTTNNNTPSAATKDNTYSYSSLQTTPEVMPRTPRPRLCYLTKQSPTDEFGFNLHAERGKGHFIGAVDESGIADLAGLETGQRIVGVNGQLVYPNTAHKEVVALIKRNPLKTELLVASEEVDHWYLENSLPYSYECVFVFEPMNNYSVSTSHNNSPHQHNNTKTTTTGTPANGMNHHRNNSYESRKEEVNFPQQINNYSSHQKRRFSEKLISTEETVYRENTNSIDESESQLHNKEHSPKDVTIIVCDNNTTSIRLTSIQDTTLASEIAAKAVAEYSEQTASSHNSVLQDKNIEYNCSEASPSPSSNKLLSKVKPSTVSSVVNDCSDYLSDTDLKSVSHSNAKVFQMFPSELIEPVSNKSIPTTNNSPEKPRRNLSILSQNSNDLYQLTQQYFNSQHLDNKNVAYDVPLNSETFNAPQRNGNASDRCSIDNGSNLSHKDIISSGTATPSPNNISSPITFDNIQMYEAYISNDNQHSRLPQHNLLMKPLLHNHHSEKNENCDIFKLNATEARIAMCKRSGGKKTTDPRLGGNNNMSLEEKYNLIANL